MPTRLTPKTSGASSSMTQGPTALASPAEGASKSRALKRGRKSGLKAVGGRDVWGGRNRALRSWAPRMGLTLLCEVRPGGELTPRLRVVFVRAGHGPAVE